MNKGLRSFACVMVVVLLLFSGILSITGLKPVAADQSGDYTYLVSSGNATITGYTGSGGAIIIPSTLDGDAVEAIGNQSFEYCNSLTSVTIQGSVTTIGEGAFSSCANLTSVTIPSSVIDIGTGAFLYCYDLTSIDVNAANPNYASVNGVLYNKTMTNLIQCPGGTTGSFTIPDSVTSIGSRAFNTCPFLTSITISRNVSRIGEYAIIQCGSLTSIDVNAANPNYASVNGVLYNKTMTNLIQCPGGTTGSFTIPDSVTSIGVWALSYCPLLTSVIIPQNVTSIGYAAFYSCTSLSSITFSGLVAPTTVGDNWLAETSSEINGHAYAASNFPAQGSTFNALTMGAVIPTVPSAPTGLSANPGNTQVVLAWTTPINDGGSAIIGYKIYRSATENGTYYLIVSSFGLNCTDTGLTNGQTYWYKVTAMNINGEGSQSTAVSVAIPQNDNSMLILVAAIVIIIVLWAALLVVRKRKSKK